MFSVYNSYLRNLGLLESIVSEEYVNIFDDLGSLSMKMYMIVLI